MMKSTRIFSAAAKRTVARNALLRQAQATDGAAAGVADGADTAAGVVDGVATVAVDGVAAAAGADPGVVAVDTVAAWAGADPSMVAVDSAAAAGEHTHLRD